MKLGLGAWGLALLFFSLQLDRGITFGGFTVFHNEIFLALLLPLAWAAASADAGGRNERMSWILAFLPLGIWLGLHAFGPDSPWAAAKALLRAAQLACGLALPCLLLKTRKEFEFVLGAALLALIASSLWAFAQSVAGPGHALNAGREGEFITGFQAAAAGFGHHNQMGAFFAAAFCLSLGALLSGTQRSLAAAALAASLVGLACSYSRGAWGAAALALACFLPLMPARPRAALLLAGALLLLAGLFGPSDAFRSRLTNLFADGNRAEQLRAAWQLWHGHALWGWGSAGLEAQAKAVAATLLDLSDEGRAAFASHMHNSYLQIGLSWGWPALLGWVIFMREAVRRALRAWTLAGARFWAAGLLGALLAFALQALTDLLTLHARGLAVSLCWGLMLAGIKLARGREARVAPLG